MTLISNDTWVDNHHQAKRYGKGAKLQVESGQRRALIWGRLAAPRKAGVDIGTSVIRLYAKGNSTGSRTISAQRLADKFVQSKANWNNQPGVTGAVASVVVGTLNDGDLVEIDVSAIAQTMVGGAANYGFRITTTDGDPHYFYSSEAAATSKRPKWVTTWSEIPEAPSVRPNGGKISAAKPVFVFDYDGPGEVTSVQVQIDAAADGSSPDFNSGEVAVGDAPELDTADTAFGGITNGATTYHRGRVKAGGVWSQWSDWVQIVRKAKFTLTIDNPSSGVVTEPTPPIIGSITGGEDLTAYRVWVWDGDRDTVLWDSKRQSADDPDGFSITLPAKVNGRRLLTERGGVYSLLVRAWGDEDRVSAPGDPAFVYEWVDFELDDVVGVDTPTDLVVTSNGDQPGCLLSFEIEPDAPDSIVIERGNKIIESNLPPEDALVSGTSYQYVDIGARPFHSQGYRVRKVVNGEMSLPTPTVTGRSTPGGVWIVDKGRDLRFGLWGTDVGDWEFTDQGANYEPIGSPYMVRIVSAVGGMRGSVQLELRDRDGLTREDMLEDLWAIKERPTRPVQLIAADWSFPVVLDKLSPGPHPEAHEDDLRKLVTLAFHQVDDLPFQARV